MKTFFYFLLLLNTVSAQICDSSLSPENNQSGYKLRGNRCEGMYSQQVSNTTELRLIGFNKGSFNYNLQTDRNIIVKTPYDANIRAVGVVTPYRMDASITSTGSLNWTVNEVLRYKNIKAKDIGLFAWIQDNNNVIYTYCSSTTDSFSNTDSKIRLIITPSKDISLVKWRYTNRGTDSSNFVDWIQINRRYYQNRKIILELPTTMTSGDYQIEIQAQQIDGNWADPLVISIKI